MLLELSLALLAYLLGSVSAAIVVSRLMGLTDPRTVGSRNPGATNVLRHSGRKAAAITLAGDLLKGLLPVLAGHALAVSPGGLALIGLAAFLGHLFPLYFGFRGGKGVATFIGVLLGYAWPLGLGFCAVWVLVAGTLRYSSLSALIATALTPFIGLLIAVPRPVLAAVCVMAVLVYWRHRANIRNLLEGRETKIGRSTKV